MVEAKFLDIIMDIFALIGLFFYGTNIFDIFFFIYGIYFGLRWWGWWEHKDI